MLMVKLKSAIAMGDVNCREASPRVTRVTEKRREKERTEQGERHGFREHGGTYLSNTFFKKIFKFKRGMCTSLSYILVSGY